MSNPRPLRVLVTDDDPIQLRIAARLLRELGHSGALAPGGEKALDMLERQLFDVMLLDLNMPGLDGLGTLAALRQRKANGQRTLPVLLVSGHDLSANWAYYREAGASGHLAKPLDIETLQAALQRL